MISILCPYCNTKNETNLAIHEKYNDEYER